MSGTRLTWRVVEDEKIYGTWRHAWIRNGKRLLLVDAMIYADGVVDCGGATGFEEFAAKVRADQILPGPPYDAMDMPIEDFIGEVRDDIERLNHRPTAEQRCMDAAEAYARDPSEENLALLRAVYEQVPGRDAMYAFCNEGPFNRDNIWILVAGIGNQVETIDGIEVVDEELRAEAMDSLIRNRANARKRNGPPPEGTAEPVEPSVMIPFHRTVNGVGVSLHTAQPPDVIVLRKEYPGPIEVAGRKCEVTHAFWALSVADRSLRERLLDMKQADAITAAIEAPRREDWPRIQTAVMAELLRAKFARHPELAAVLRDTGNARILHDGVDRFWDHNGRDGRNWMGRLLEQIRAERAAGTGVLEL
ncbi:hypothetical protein GCM10009839_17220 [Catenulispora yoronensis]|uniref:Riboflavin biosynthesis intermediates N-glycosidase n=1 Tax=Catenulispora yoronensis TaxID=450799 RepID=A0ABN2TTD1_9ACTN